MLFYFTQAAPSTGLYGYNSHGTIMQEESMQVSCPSSTPRKAGWEEKERRYGEKQESPPPLSYGPGSCSMLPTAARRTVMRSQTILLCLPFEYGTQWASLTYEGSGGGVGYGISNLHRGCPTSVRMPADSFLQAVVSRMYTAGVEGQNFEYGLFTSVLICSSSFCRP